MSDGDRPQDVGRSHARRRAAPDAATAAMLDRYRAAMLDELGDTLDELRPGREQLTLDGGAQRIRPQLADRVKLWDLAIKLGRELAAAPDELPPEPGDTAAVPARRSRAPRLSAKDRRAIA